MILIGEKLNTSIPKTQTAVAGRDTDYLINLIETQVEAGADYLDINTAAGVEDELESMKWLTKLALDHSQAGIMLDSPSPEVISEAIQMVQGRPVIVNSVTLASRLELLPLIRETGSCVVALPIDDGGIPDTAQSRADNAGHLLDKITQAGIPPEKIFIDVLAESLAVSDLNLMRSIETILAIRSRFPGLKTVCGVSNVSFGLPKRININTAFLSAAVVAGLSAAILDVTSPTIKSALLSSLAVAGLDEYCLNYIAYMRSQQ